MSDISSFGHSVTMSLSLRRDSSEESLVHINMEDLETYSLDVMTKSQYSQVVFHDISDIYSFDKDIVCKYTLTEGIESEHGDRVGLYKVPFFSAHEYVAFAWGKVKQRAEGKKEQEMEVILKAGVLPKDEDFYQFQYIRSDNIVLGASIPFQLKMPVAKEAKETESGSKSDEEFMVVDKCPSSASKRLNDKFSSLSEENKQLQARLSQKEEEYKSLLELSEKLNEDLKKKAESFVRLEKEHESMKMTRNKNVTQIETDLIYVLKDKQRLEEKLRQSTDQALALHRQDSDLTILTLDREMAGLSHKLAIKETEVVDLRCQVEELGEKMDFVQTENDSLRTQLTSITRERDECFERNGELMATIRRLRLQLDEGKVKEEVEEDKEVQISVDNANAGKGNKDYVYLYEKSQSRISQLEQRLNEFEVELRQSDMMNAASVRQLKEELDEFRSNVNSIYGSPSTTSLTRNLNSQVILVALEASNGLMETRVPIVAQPTGLHHAPLDLTKEAIKPKKTQTEEEEPWHHLRKKSPFLERAQNTFFNLLPQIPGTVFRTTTPGRVISTPQDTPPPMSTTTSEATLPPTKIGALMNETTNQQFDFEEDSSDFSDLVAWARSNVYKKQAPKNEGPLNDPVDLVDPVESAKDLLAESLAPPTFEEATASAEVLQKDSAEILDAMPLTEMIPPPAPPTKTPLFTKTLAPLTLDQDDIPPFASAHPTAPLSAGNPHATPTVNPPPTTEDTPCQVFALTDDGRILDLPAEEEDEKLQCPVCDFRMEKSKYRELEFHVESHLATSLVCPVCSQKYPLGDPVRRVVEYQSLRGKGL